MADWNDYHLLLVLNRTGTLGAAARYLAVNETTVSRRLAAAETSFGVTLFQRSGRKLVPTQAGQDLLKAAKAMETALNDQVQALSKHSGRVRISALPFVLDHLIAPRLHQFSSRFPHIALECVAASEKASLAQREADIGLRLSRPTDGKLKIRKVMDIEFRLATSRTYLLDIQDGTRLDYLAYDSALDALPEIAAIKTYFGGEPRHRLSTISSILQAVKAGAGAAMLPGWLIDQNADVTDLSPSVRAHRELWLVVHEDLAERAVVRSVLDWLSEILGRP